MSALPQSLQGRVAIITGGGRGIGEAVALQFAQAGAKLVIASRTADELEHVAERCRSLGAECVSCVTDVSDFTAVNRLIDFALQRWNRIDILVNAAGVYGPIGLLQDVDMRDWTTALQTNLMGTVYACHAVLPAMIAQGAGNIINFSGGGATGPLPRFSAYGVSKAAIVRLTETLAQEVSRHGIRVNAVAPGAVDTKLQDEVIKAGAQAGDLYTRMLAMRESGTGSTPIDVPASLALFLASDASAGLTGRLISAPNDPWQEWDAAKIAAFSVAPWYTLRRLDPYTIAQLSDVAP